MATETSTGAVHRDESVSRNALDKEFIDLGFADHETISVLAAAISSARLVEYKPQDVIYREGDSVSDLYVIRKGKVKLVSYLASGRARIVRLHSRGSVLGLGGFLDEPHEHTAIAAGDVQVYQVAMTHVGPIKERDPAVYSRLLEQWYGYLNDADTWITQFSTGPIRERVASLIHYLMEIDEVSEPSAVTLLTCEEMADILGVTPESVSKVTADFKRRKILVSDASDDPDHYLCDVKALAREMNR